MATDAIQLPIRRNPCSRCSPGSRWPCRCRRGAGGRSPSSGSPLLYRLLENVGWRRRLLLGYLTGLGQFAIGLFWMSEFTLPGSVIAILGFGLFVAAAAVITPSQPGWRRAIAFPSRARCCSRRCGCTNRWAACRPVACSSARSPGCSAPPLASAVRSSSSPWPRWSGVALAERSWMPGACSRSGSAALVARARHGRTGRHTDGPVDRRRPRAGRRPPRLPRHRVQPRRRLPRAPLASERLRAPLDLILWPEDVIDIDDAIDISPVGADLAAIAQRFGATLVAGVVEGEGTDQFRNAAVAWSPDGRHHRPLREGAPRAVRRVRAAPVAGRQGGDLSAVPADAIAGHGPEHACPRRPAGSGVAISYEVFFADRGRNATRTRRRGAARAHQRGLVQDQPDAHPGIGSRPAPGGGGRPNRAPGRPNRLLGGDHARRAGAGPIRPRPPPGASRLGRPSGGAARATHGPATTPWLALAALGILTARSRFRKRV